MMNFNKYKKTINLMIDYITKFIKFCNNQYDFYIGNINFLLIYYKCVLHSQAKF